MSSLPKLTLGIEEEYQIIDPDSGELTSYVQELLEQGRWVLQDQLKPELMQSQIEVGSHICNDVQESARGARTTALRRSASSPTATVCRWWPPPPIPSHKWQQQEVSHGARYDELAQELGDVARRMLIFGMHVHIGIDDREVLVDVMNQMQYFLPHILALSSSSPFWHGRETGLKSYRSVIFENLPQQPVWRPTSPPTASTSAPSTC